MHCFRANTWYRSENPRAVCVFVSPVLIPSSTNRRVDHFHPTRYLSHLPAGIFYCMPLRKIITQWNFLCLWSKIIGHLRVPKTLTFKMKLGAQPFLWKWILFAWEWKMISISNVEPLPSFWNFREARGTRKWPIRKASLTHHKFFQL